MQSQELPLEVRDEARRIVFNNMSIRMLLFDRTGAQIQLLERNQVLSRVLSRIATDIFTNGLGTKTALASYTGIASQYAILSHTWIREVPGDVVYQDWSARALNARGYAKIAKVLPERCLAVPLACAVRNGVVDLSTDMSIVPVAHPVVFALHGDARYAHRRVRVAELPAHGMQLATVHLP